MDKVRTNNSISDAGLKLKMALAEFEAILDQDTTVEDKAQRRQRKKMLEQIKSLLADLS